MVAAPAPRCARRRGMTSIETDETKLMRFLFHVRHGAARGAHALINRAVKEDALQSRGSHRGDFQYQCYRKYACQYFCKYPCKHPCSQREQRHRQGCGSVQNRADFIDGVRCGGFDACADRADANLRSSPQKAPPRRAWTTRPCGQPQGLKPRTRSPCPVRSCRDAPGTKSDAGFMSVSRG